MPNKVTIEHFSVADLKKVQELVHHTIDVSYRHAYPQAAIDFFHEHHKDANLLQDHEQGFVIIMRADDSIQATGTLVENEIKRFFGIV